MTFQNSSDEVFNNSIDGFSLGGGKTSRRTLSLSGANFPINLSSVGSGNILQFDGTNWINVNFSTPGTGTVTNIATGTGLTGGPITTTGTISMATSGVSAGTYGSGTAIPQIVVDALGRVTSAITETALGSMATQNSNNVNITGGTITGMPTPVNATDVVNKSYVDNLTSGLTSHQSCRMATAGTNISATYSNGVSGVGATLTYIATGSQTVDGVTPALGDRILVKDQTSQLQNGIYTWTTLGTTGTSGILTRAADFDQTGDGEVEEGAYTIIEEGTTNKGTLWIETGQGPFTIGVTSIIFTELNVAQQINTYTGDVTGSGAGTIALTLATVNANIGTFGDNTHTAIVTVNAKGLITAISTGATALGTGSVTNIATGTGLTGGPITNAGTVSVATNGISNALFRQSGANTIVGNPTGSTANVTDITLGATLAFVSGSLQTIAMTGDVTTSANSFATVISAGAITYSKIQNEGTKTLLGNPGTTATSPSEITIGTGLIFSGTNLQIGTSGVTSGTYGDASDIPQITVDALGRIISAINIPATGFAGIFHPGIGSGDSQYYSSFTPKDTTVNTTLTANILYAIPILLPAGAILTRIGYTITTKANTGSARLGIYSNNPANGRPQNLLVDAGTTSITTLGDKEIVINYTNSGAWVWLCLVTSNGIAVGAFDEGGNANSLLNIFGRSSSSSATNQRSETNFTIGTFPATYPTGGSLTTGNTPFIWVRSV